MSLSVVFDDSLAMPRELRALVGVDHFGGLVFQRRSRLEAMRTLADDAEATLVTLRSPEERRALIERLREEDQEHLFLYCPSHLVAIGDNDTLATFLKQIRYAPGALFIPLEGARDRRGWALAPAPLIRKLLIKQEEGDLAEFFEQNGEALVDVPGRLRLIDVSDERTLLDFLSGQFDARHFNMIERHDHTVVKRSRDRAKLKREFEFYRLVPPEMQMFLVQPFDFNDDGVAASYRMERLSVPDMALQWVHGALTASEFERFLDHIFFFFASRPTKRADRAQTRAAQNELYIDKVTSRIAALKRRDDYHTLAPLLDQAFGGIDALVARYMKAFERVRARLPNDKMAIGHGDPCFSNILYLKTNQILKLIDPRGADGESDLYTDSYYDIAKLSHSALGGYDFINLDMFDIAIDERLKPRLDLVKTAPAWAAPLFTRKLEAAGYDLEAVRVCEASLFISMMPLHMDRPRKVLGFALNAVRILDGVEGSKTGKDA